MNDISEINLKDTLELLLRWSWLIILTTVAGFVAAYLVSTQIMTPRFTSSISLHVNNSPEAALGTIALADINAAQRLVDTYIVILGDDDVMEMLGYRLLEEFDEQWLRNFIPLRNRDGQIEVDIRALRAMINMSSVNNTEVLRIQAQTGSALLSARICTIMSEIAPDILIRVVRAGSVEVIGTARPAELPSAPRVMQNSVLGGGAGFVLMTLVVLLVNLLDNRVKSEDELKKRFNIPILAEIPDFKIGAKRGGGLLDGL
jgi:capsular polysaccharide biosynthesis protein